jgi:hypothetical protein
MKTLGRGAELKSDGSELKLGGSIYWEGNSKALHQLFLRNRRPSSMPSAPSNDTTTPPSTTTPPKLSDDGLRVIYFGDHLRTDVVATREHTTWTAAAIVEELVHHHHDHHDHHLHDYDHGHRHIHVTGEKDEERSLSPAPSTTTAAVAAVAPSSSSDEKSNGKRSVKKYTAAPVADTWGSFFHARHAPPRATSSIIPAPSPSPSLPTSPQHNDDQCGARDTSSYWSQYVAQYSHLVLPCLSLLARAPLRLPVVHDAQGTHHCYRSYTRVLETAAQVLDDDYTHDADAPDDDDELPVKEMAHPHYGFT